jgi:protein-S-isoprenylcysteine O-methyltransferase Ste14
MPIIFQFLLLSIPAAYISRRNILHPKSHGFFRFFGWEATIYLFLCNRPYWFNEPFSFQQIISWLLLTISIYLVGFGSLFLLRKGKPSTHRNEKHLMGFEKTTVLVDTGVYKLIRHPLYASLIYLSWGIFLKHITIPLLLLTIFCTFMYYLTARHDEKECIAYFGDKYINYMTNSKMFIPFIF